jgi:hypothetical protein
MKLSKLTDEIKAREKELAYGSETMLWGDYCERMHKLTGIHPYNVDAVTDAGDPEIDEDEAQWWMDAYTMYADDQTITMEDILAKLS